jgi:thioredoxin 1
MANIITGTNENFNEVINGELPVLVDFWATWCGPCRMIGPFIEQLSEEYAGKVVFMKVNVDEEQELCMRYRISSIPNLVLFKDGDIIDQSAGARPKQQIAAFIDQAL